MMLPISADQQFLPGELFIAEAPGIAQLPQILLLRTRSFGQDLALVAVARDLEYDESMRPKDIRYLLRR
jgi:hypothetical protein